MQTTREKVRQYILANPDDHSNIDIAKRFGTTRHTVQSYRKQLRQEGLIPGFDILSRRKDYVAPDQPTFQQINTTRQEPKEKPIEEKVEEHRDKAKIKMLQQENKKLIKNYDELMEKYDQALMITEKRTVGSYSVDVNTNPDSDAVAIIQYSDWHVEEKIERSTTRGMNEYNPDIAKKRSQKLIENTLKILKKERQDVKINELVVCLGGDFINNFLHDHDVQMNYMHPIEATLYATELLTSSLKTLAENADVESIEVMCIRGNHGRQTPKMQSSNDYKMNLEAMLYGSLKRQLADDLFAWHIPESELAYLNVFDKKIRGFHGHQVSYQGGVGGLTIPLNKKIAKWDETEKADYNLMHHWHTLSMPGKHTSLNGSMCGWNSYALSCGFAFEPPLQSFQLLDKERGFTVRMPIFCE